MTFDVLAAWAEISTFNLEFSAQALLLNVSITPHLSERRQYLPDTVMDDSKDNTWPNRLLHVPTWTSFEQGRDCTYHGHQMPKYNILSYTWGRWENKTGRELHINGIKWRIPRICPTHYSPEMFQRVMERTCNDGINDKETEFIWIDVCCIDQENSKVKAKEVGRQGKIFKTAQRAFIWLVSLSTTELRQILRDLLEVGVLIDIRHKALNKLLDDPYFSSLWTLQEAFLRSDAVLVSRDGESITHFADTGNANHEDTLHVEEMYFSLDLALPKRFEQGPTCLSDILNAVKDLQSASALNSNGYGTSKSELPVSGLAKRLDEHGISALNHRQNPFLLYNTSSSRKVTRPLDSIYAIMQIYELQLGNSTEPDRCFSLSELEDQLTDGFLLISPLYSQLFVHMEASDDSCSWRMNKSSTSVAASISNNLVDYNISRSQNRSRRIVDANPFLQRNTTSGSLIWRGLRCPLATLIDYWLLALDRKSEYGPVGWPHEFAISIQLDRVKAEGRILPNDLLPANKTTLCGLSDDLNIKYGIENLCVLKLSRAPILAAPDDSMVIWSWTGVLARIMQPEGHLKRMGICIWDLHHFPAAPDFRDIQWETFQEEMM